MTTRALEDKEIKEIFENVNGTHARRNETLLKEVEEAAAMHEMAVVDYIFSEILLSARGSYIRCDECGKVLADARELLGGSTWKITCAECGKDMVFFDEA